MLACVFFFLKKKLNKFIKPAKRSLHLTPLLIKRITKKEDDLPKKKMSSSMEDGGDSKNMSMTERTPTKNLPLLVQFDSLL